MVFNERTKDLISVLIGIFSLLIPTTLFFITAPEDIKLQSIIIFGIIVIVIVIISVAYLIYSGYRNLIKDVSLNKKDISEIKKSLKFKELQDNMDIRLKVLEKLNENRNKKGQIDPRIIWIIVLLILLYLFLKSMNILP